MALLALSSVLVAMYTLAFLASNAYAHSRAQDKSGVNKFFRLRYLARLFANTSISTSDDDDFPSQVRNIIDGELGFWSEVTLDENRVEDLHEDAEGGEIAGE